MTAGETAEEEGDLAALHNAIDQHLVGNYLDLPGAPLMLCVVGDPGIGKTYTIKQHLTACMIAPYEISASAMAHHMEGVAVKPLIRCYRDASARLGVQSAAVIIDDIDRSIMANYRSIGHTVHSQLLTGFLMDLCDNPRRIVTEDAGSTRSMADVERVPVFLTANALTGLDTALTRPQRMRIFRFNPTTEDRCAMIASALQPEIGMSFALSTGDFAALELRFRTQPIAFFGDLYATLLAGAMPNMNGPRFFNREDMAVQLKARRYEWLSRLGQTIAAYDLAVVMSAAERLERARMMGLGGGGPA